MNVIVAYLGCGCVVWYADRKYLPQPREDGLKVRVQCPRCSKPASDVLATEARHAEAVG